MPKTDRTYVVNPLSDAINNMLETKAARPRDVYRLAVILESLMESLDNPTTLKTIRHELRILINDLSETIAE